MDLSSTMLLSQNHKVIIFDINCAKIEFDNPNELSQKNFLIQDNNHINYKQYIENSLVASGIAGEMGSKQIIDDIKYYYQIN